jgi:transcriptional regulator NrdR family protein
MDNRFIEHEEEVASGNTCDVCGKHFSTMSNLRRHMVIHSADTSYKCDVCDQEFVSFERNNVQFRLIYLKDESIQRSIAVSVIAQINVSFEQFSFQRKHLLMKSCTKKR